MENEERKINGYHLSIISFQYPVFRLLFPAKHLLFDEFVFKGVFTIKCAKNYLCF